MMRYRALALVAVPAALLVGSAAPTLAAEDSAPTSGATSASCSAPALDAVVTAEETVRRVEACRTTSASQAPSWHWMGNYGSVYDVQNAANSLGVGAGGLVTQVQPSGSGLFPTFMYH
jgi:hypothetical protein